MTKAVFVIRASSNQPEIGPTLVNQNNIDAYIRHEELEVTIQMH